MKNKDSLETHTVTPTRDQILKIVERTELSPNQNSEKAKNGTYSYLREFFSHFLPKKSIKMEMINNRMIFVLQDLYDLQIQERDFSKIIDELSKDYHIKSVGSYDDGDLKKVLFCTKEENSPQPSW